MSRELGAVGALPPALLRLAIRYGVPVAPADPKSYVELLKQICMKEGYEDAVELLSYIAGNMSRRAGLGFQPIPTESKVEEVHVRELEQGSKKGASSWVVWIRCRYGGATFTIAYLISYHPRYALFTVEPYLPWLTAREASGEKG